MGSADCPEGPDSCPMSGPGLVVALVGERGFRGFLVPRAFAERALGFKIRYSQECVGSIPTFGTAQMTSPRRHRAPRRAGNSRRSDDHGKGRQNGVFTSLAGSSENHVVVALGRSTWKLCAGMKP